MSGAMVRTRLERRAGPVIRTTATSVGLLPNGGREPGGDKIDHQVDA